MKTDKIVITTPSGKIIEMLNEQEYFDKCTLSSSMSTPIPNDYNNWARLLIKDDSIYETLTVDDKIFIMRQQYLQYTTLWHYQDE